MSTNATMAITETVEDFLGKIRPSSKTGNTVCRMSDGIKTYRDFALWHMKTISDETKFQFRELGTFSMQKLGELEVKLLNYIDDNRADGILNKQISDEHRIVVQQIAALLGEI